MEYTTLHNGIKMPLEGFGVFQGMGSKILPLISSVIELLGKILYKNCIYPTMKLFFLSLLLN